MVIARAPAAKSSSTAVAKLLLVMPVLTVSTTTEATFAKIAVQGANFANGALANALSAKVTGMLTPTLSPAPTAQSQSVKLTPQKAA